MGDADVLSPRANLDHVIVTLDSETYRQMTSSDFLRNTFGRFDIKTASSSVSASYTSAAIAGVHTFIELFDERAPLMDGMAAGIIFSLEKEGAIKTVRKNLEANVDAELRYMLNKRQVDGYDEKMPFYHLLEVDYGPDSPFWSTVAEVDPWYFNYQGLHRDPDGAMDRAEYLNAALPAALEPHHYMQDVVEIDLVLHADRAKTFGEKLGALGFAAETNGSKARFSNQELSILVVTDDGAREGILRVRNSLRRELEEETTSYRFGTGAKLELDRSSATWTFSPLELQG